MDAFKVCASASRETVEHRLISPFLSVSTIRQLRCRCPCYATEIGIACFPSVSQKQQAEQPNLYGSPVVPPVSYCVAKQGTKQKGTYKGSSRTPFKPTKDRERKKPGDSVCVKKATKGKTTKKVNREEEG